MSTSIKHKEFVSLVKQGLKKAIDRLIDESIQQNDELVVIDPKGNIKCIKARELKK
jgi:hypothetical protein